jgi:hypothetical protein
MAPKDRAALAVVPFWQRERALRWHAAARVLRRLVRSYVGQVGAEVA